MDDILNISAYRFVDIDSPQALRERLLPAAQRAGLLGTILIAREGINLFLAGAPDAVRGFMDELRADARFAGLTGRESLSATPPFRRLLASRMALRRAQRRRTIPSNLRGSVAERVAPAISRRGLTNRIGSGPRSQVGSQRDTSRGEARWD